MMGFLWYDVKQWQVIVECKIIVEYDVEYGFFVVVEIFGVYIFFVCVIWQMCISKVINFDELVFIWYCEGVVIKFCNSCGYEFVEYRVIQFVV